MVGQYGRSLLWAQAIASNETPTTALISAKQATYTGIANSIQQNDPGVYPLFQGNQWTTRLEIAFGAVFAALVAGLLILLIALTLIVLKLGFLLLLVAGPFFLIVGTHPGFGRVIAIRWFEMLVGVLMKQVAIAIVLSVLLYCYSLIMGTTDAVLPWALKILMIALVTVAVFIYRKPFQHLFSAVGYGTIGSSERAEYSLRQAGSTFRRSTLDAATVAVPGVAGYRAARWARRNPGQAAAMAARRGQRRESRAPPPGRRPRRRPRPGPARSPARRATRTPRGCGPTPRPRSTGRARRAGFPPRGQRAGGSARNRNLPEADSGGGRVAPPLDLPPRSATNGSAGSAGASGSTGSAGVGRDFRGRRDGVRAGPAAPVARRPPGPWARARGPYPPGRPHPRGRSGSAGSAAAHHPKQRSGSRRSSGGQRRQQKQRGQRRGSGSSGGSGGSRSGRPGLAGQQLAGCGGQIAVGHRAQAQPGRPAEPAGQPRPERPGPGPGGPAETARTTGPPRRSGCARYGGTSSGRPPWISTRPSRRPSSPWSSSCSPRSATGSCCPS